MSNDPGTAPLPPSPCSPARPHTPPRVTGLGPLRELKVRLPTLLLEDLRDRAHEEDRSLSQTVRQAIWRYLS